MQLSRPERGALAVVGAINWDISIFEKRFARPGEEVPVSSVEEFSGGKGANVAVAAARILGRGRVAMLGALGTDEIGHRQRKELRREGVDVEAVATVSGARSGRAYILVDGEGSKTIHTHFGANDEVTPQLIGSAEASNAISKAEMVVVMDPPTAAGLAAATAAKKSGATLLFSPGVRTQEGLRGIDRTVELSDYLFLDRAELANLVRSGDEVEALDRLRARFPGLTVVATLGASGCTLASGRVVSTADGVSGSELGKKVLNTTGCGDAFLGVFASYLMMGAPPLKAAAWANLAGAIKATRYETRGSPFRGELEKEMRRLERARRLPPASRQSTAS